MTIYDLMENEDYRNKLSNKISRISKKSAEYLRLKYNNNLGIGSDRVRYTMLAYFLQLKNKKILDVDGIISIYESLQCFWFNKKLMETGMTKGTQTDLWRKFTTLIKVEEKKQNQESKVKKIQVLINSSVSEKNKQDDFSKGDIIQLDYNYKDIKWSMDRILNKVDNIDKLGVLWGCVNNNKMSGYIEKLILEKYLYFTKYVDENKKEIIFKDLLNETRSATMLNYFILSKLGYYEDEDELQNKILILADCGNISAKVEVASWYLNPAGYIVEKDEKKAFEYYKSAALLCHPDGITGLAIMYDNGFYVPENKKVSARLYKISGLYLDDIQEIYPALKIFSKSYKENGCGQNEHLETISQQTIKIQESEPKESKSYAQCEGGRGSKTKHITDENRFNFNEMEEKNKTNASIIHRVNNINSNVYEKIEIDKSVASDFTLDRVDSKDIANLAIEEKSNKHDENFTITQNEVKTLNNKENTNSNKNRNEFNGYSKELEQSFWDESRNYISKNMKIDSCYCAGASDKADKKIQSAIKSYAGNMSSDDKPVVVFDATLFGGADEGCLFTQKGVYIHNQGDEKTYFLKYKEIKSISIKGVLVKDVYLNELKVVSALLHDGKELFCTLVEFLKEVAATAESGEWLNE